MRWWLAIGWMLGGWMTAGCGGAAAHDGAAMAYMEDLDNGVSVTRDGVMTLNSFRVDPPPTPPSLPWPATVSAAGWERAGRPAYYRPGPWPQPAPFESLAPTLCPARTVPPASEPTTETPTRHDVVTAMLRATARVIEMRPGDEHGYAIVRFTLSDSTGLPVAVHVEPHGLSASTVATIADTVCGVDVPPFTRASFGVSYPIRL